MEMRRHTFVPGSRRWARPRSVARDSSFTPGREESRIRDISQHTRHLVVLDGIQHDWIITTSRTKEPL